jgi:hypothetical protein
MHKRKEKKILAYLSGKWGCVTFFPVLMFGHRGVEFIEELVGVAQLVKLSHPKGIERILAFKQRG